MSALRLLMQSIKRSEQAIWSLLRRGPSDRIRTCGILLPKQARYQLRYTRSASECARSASLSAAGLCPSAKKFRIRSRILPFQTKSARGFGLAVILALMILAQFPKKCNAFVSALCRLTVCRVVWYL